MWARQAVGCGPIRTSHSEVRFLTVATSREPLLGTLPPLVNASLDRPGGALFHFDGEFSTMEELTAGTFTGRNFGWLPGQKAEAIAHIARVMRDDDGMRVIAQQFDGLPYRLLFTGSNPNIPDELRLPPEFRVLIGSGTD
jgi:hypothetical protein